MAPEAQRIQVLVIEEDEHLGRMIARTLTSDGMEVELVHEPSAVVKRLDAGADWDVVVMELGRPGLIGLELLDRFRESDALASVIMLTGDNTAATAATCLRAGAFHYVSKPFHPFELSTVVRSAARHATLRRQLQRKTADRHDLLVGTSAAIRRLHAALDRLATQSVSILIEGERGTGKELVARTLHDRSERKSRRFVALDCGAIPDSLIDSELFGHSKGAFTGATSDRPGVFVEADGGTLFLDEIGDMPLGIQSRLLRVLQEGEVRPVGDSGVRQIDVRVVTASHVDLKAAVEHGRFRQDLFSRLNVVVLTVPPLRERLDDLPLLAAHFLRRHGGATPPSLSPSALEAMTNYAWPGNVRELENALVHALALHHGDVIGVESLPNPVALRGLTTRHSGVINGTTDEELLPLTEAKRRASNAFEKRYLTRVMAQSKGSVSEAARLAQLDRTNFRRLLQRHGIDPTTFKS